MATAVPYGQYWWVNAVAGIFAILFGIAAIVWPGITLGVLVILFGVYVLIDGALAIVHMFRQIGAHETWWPSLILGIIGIAAGLFILTYPGPTAVLLLYVIAFWAIFAGFMEIMAGLFGAHFLLMVVGIISIVFGFVLLGNPAAGALALVVVIGIFSIIRGILLLVEAIRAPAMPAMP